MSKPIKKLILYVLVWVPISSVSFAAKAALQMDLATTAASDVDVDHGDSESRGGGPARH